MFRCLHGKNAILTACCTYARRCPFSNKEYLLTQSTKPQLGPFIDIAHPRIKSGDVDEMPSRTFLKRFIGPLNSFLEGSPESLILLEPSIRDILSDHPVYPQSELENSFERRPLDPV